MAGVKTGVATHINEIEPQVHLRHCHGHALQLAIGETIKTIKIMKSTPDAAFELNKLVKYSIKKIQYSLKKEGTSNRLREYIASGKSGDRELR